MKTSVSLTAEAKKLLDQLSTALGVTKTAVIEIAIRKLAKEYK